MFKVKKIYLVLFPLAVAAGLFVFSTHHKEVDFNSEVKPIFNSKCISCHGGVKKQANFSVLFRSEAVSKTKSGKYGIVPGDPEHSEMIKRINATDPEDRMPYHHKPLSEKEITTLTNWVKQGAKWGDHWAFVPVQRPDVPQPTASFFGWFGSKKRDWGNNDIDAFIYAKIQQQNLAPSAEADRATLLRRVSLDVTGLPAPESLQRKFLKEGRSYEELVDSLLASPHFGEKWTALWLDIARYADTKGYERDGSRSIWRYRDWLIRAFNDDMPYNQFLTEQIAGDLLPDATDEQLIATAFNRNTMTNDEGGTDNEEFRTAAIIDRVNTTWQGLLGTTFACVQCHSHPYDPFTHDEYYKFMAFYNDTRDEDTWHDYPLLRLYNRPDSGKLAKLMGWMQQNNFSEEAKSTSRFLKTWQPSINSLRADSFINSALYDTKWLGMRNASVARIKGVKLDGKTRLIYRYASYTPGGKWSIHLDKTDGPLLAIVNLDTSNSWKIAVKQINTVNGVHDLYFTYANPSLKDATKKGLQFDWFYFTTDFPGKGLPGYDSCYKAYLSLLTSTQPATVPVMIDNPADMHRITHVFERGNWLVKGAEVEAATPHSLNPFPDKAPRNRLGMAQWLTDEKNPLTARTMVNRLWEQLFGNGIVETLDDLGTQGAEPTHRELLDFLSYQFMKENKWSIKKLLKEIVLSATYRQDSKLTKEGLEKDPLNKYYARGPRVRLSAEEVRDQALAISGVLSTKMYGPSVMPWQPEGVWMSPYSGEAWKKSKGEDQYRRSVYTFLKRTAPYPSLISFDGVGREVCTARRIRTNTPLQALVTLNDSVYLEAARYFAYAVQKKTGKKNIREQIQAAYQMAMYKPISPAKLDALQKLYFTALQKFESNKENTCEMIGMNNEHNTPATAALVVVTSAILNLDELITKS